MRYRLLIFDFDGTLADSFPAFLGHMRQTVEHFKLRAIDEQTLDELRGQAKAITPVVDDEAPRRKAPSPLEHANDVEPVP